MNDLDSVRRRLSSLAELRLEGPLATPLWQEYRLLCEREAELLATQPLALST
jgi:hypothetical protein